MKVINARNVHQALPEALYQLLYVDGRKRESRNGPVTVFQEPVTTVYQKPTERVMFWPERDCNPFFHLYESLWMLGGRNDVESVAKYAERMRTYSDDGLTLHGAYGFRWREHFAKDQLSIISGAMRNDFTDRRQVLSMWDANADLGRDGKDLPCNLQCGFMITDDGELDMIVTNRSNDIVWGAYGANAVHFSYLQEYIAAQIGVSVGRYRQMSWNFHGYDATVGGVKHLSQIAQEVAISGPEGWREHCPYTAGLVQPYPLVNIHPDAWDEDLEDFLSGDPGIPYADPFFIEVAEPMREAHAMYKSAPADEKYDATLRVLERVKATDWKLAAVQWIERRQAKALQLKEAA
jgi:hypothetical protein